MKDGHREEYHDVVDQRFLGEERFFEKLKAQPEEELETSRCKKPVSAAFRDVARAFEIELSVLSGADRGWETSRARALVACILIRRLGYKLTDVATCFEEMLRR